MTVQGTSSLHDWESAIEKIECKGFYAMANNSLMDVKDVVVKIPVTSIKSTKGKIMDNKTYDAFNYEKYPNIVFTLSAQKINEKNSTIDLTGNLAMAGTTKSVNLTANYKILPNGELQIIGSKKIIMTDFGMEPPTAMMGTIKVGNDVSVYFEITLTNNNTIL
jgi:polyisoprenoid-binding protein YceI